jgi:lipoprotein-releasing system ATP-binding protein
MNSDMPETDFLLQAEQLGKHYREGSSTLKVLQDIDLQMHAGERLAIIGASGSGKSTLLNLLGGLDEPSTGRVLIDDKDFSHMDEQSRCRIRNHQLGFIYQFHHLLPEFSALENVAMPLLIDGMDVTLASQQAEAALSEMGLAQRLHHKPGELSGGERQRAAIARALIHTPKCILADEPTGNLDRKNAQQVIDIIAELNTSHNTALIIVTHDMQIAEKMDRILELEDGRLKTA